MAAVRPPVALAVAISGIAAFAIMDAVMKRLTLANGVFAALLWRNGAGILLSGPLYLWKGQGWPRGQALRLHVERGLVSAAMSLLFFWALARMPMAQAVGLSFVAPLIALGLAALLLGERVGRRAILGSLLALGGVGVIMAGQAQAAGERQSLLGVGAVLLSALLYAYNIILMRRQSLVAPPVDVAFFQNVTVAGSLALGAFLFPARLAGPGELPLVVAGAALATVSLLLLAWAYAYAEASYLSVGEYTALIWSATLGWAVFGERLSRYTVAGVLLIVAGCILASRRANGELPVEAEL